MPTVSMLSQTDLLRLNVLMASDPLAIRIDESRLTVHGLRESGESTIKLNPVGGDTRYLKAVREWLSSQALGFPGGFPVFLRQWTRVGAVRESSIAPLMLLGEPEAFRAILSANELNHRQVRSLWWALPETDTARRLLRLHAAMCGDLAGELCDYLIDYLPFETDPESIIDSVELVLTTNAIKPPIVETLWRKAQKQNSYLVGFLAAGSDCLPAIRPERPGYADRVKLLSPLTEQGHPLAMCLEEICGSAGQSFLDTCRNALKKPADQQVVYRLIDIIAGYFRKALLGEALAGEFVRTEAVVDERISSGDDELLQPLLRLDSSLVPKIRAILILALLSDATVNPVFSTSTSTGAQMRKKLAPIFQCIDRELAVLLGDSEE